MKSLFDNVSVKTSKLVTNSYSTSFSLGIKFLDKDFHAPIYAIYGFVRFADEIVDTFHDYDKNVLLDEFSKDTYKAIEEGISLNPILNSFQQVVRDYKIDHSLIEAFLHSMKMDLSPQEYDQMSFEKYILGSAEVVGLMCLRVFCYGDQKVYDLLKDNAMSLGSAFQKINFLRDLKADYEGLNRSYFPGLDLENFDDQSKKQIEQDILEDFNHGYEGILKLPKKSRFGVYVAYKYYLSLYKKIAKVPAQKVLEQRIRIPNEKKYALFVSSYVKHSFNIL